MRAPAITTSCIFWVGIYKNSWTKLEPKNDTLSYQYQPNPVKYSKRAVLSEVARIYDPLGLLSPVMTDLKRLMKYLWLMKVSWDEPLPEEAVAAWLKYHQEYHVSWEAAYAAAVYLRLTIENEEPYCHLLMGKSRIAPVAKVSIPRLELCDAGLLARLLSFVQTNQTLKFVNVTA
ncbi:uncharacterized protein LOC113557831 [Rhopalosiphum maidis]|uniref:uncharacterized protein LOC113557831 n=1 Tax=Rhopalosiphum maidis TaxID=43146 RepID=UPI000EFF746E|nr:uncharacterized protein LOC113557831 [Rhopalosiphum maidis]